MVKVELNESETYSVEFLQSCGETIIHALKGFDGIKACYCRESDKLKVAKLEFDKSKWTKEKVVEFLHAHYDQIVSFNEVKPDVHLAEKITSNSSIMEKLSMDMALPYVYNGVALTEGTWHGKFYPYEELKKGCMTLKGKKITLDHGDTAMSSVGIVDDVWFNDEKRRIEYRGKILDDEACARKVHTGSITDNSVEVWGDNEIEDKRAVRKNLEFKGISLVLHGECPFPGCGILPELNQNIAA